MNHGLTDRDLQTIFRIFEKYPDVETVCLFGSRAKGNYHTGSDIDMAVMNDGVTNETIRHLLSDFEDSLLPYFTDVVNYHKLEHKDLKEHIDRVGVLFYEREKTIIPEWHKSIVAERMEEYKRNPDIAQDFDDAIDDIEKELGD